MPRFVKCVQGEQGWHDARAGHATASRFGDILAGKGAREAYMWELVAERLAGPMRDAGGMAKSWGTDAEDLARREFCARTGELVEQVGLALHDRIKWCACSTDGLVAHHAFIEIKSPFNSGIHARTLAKGMPDIHIPQVMGNAWILRRDQPIFISYDPAFEKPYNCFIQYLKRDEKFIKHLEAEVKNFLAEVAVATHDIQHSNDQRIPV